MYRLGFILFALTNLALMWIVSDSPPEFYHQRDVMWIVSCLCAIGLSWATCLLLNTPFSRFTCGLFGGAVASSLLDGCVNGLKVENNLIIYAGDGVFYAFNLADVAMFSWYVIVVTLFIRRVKLQIKENKRLNCQSS